MFFSVSGCQGEITCHNDGMVRPEKLEELKERMKTLGIREEDFIEKFVRGSGKGGQKINKTSNCVYLRHVPSDIGVKCQMDRSRELNRFLARREICDTLEAVIKGEKSVKTQAIEKMRRQKRRKSRRQRARMCDDKKHHSGIKANRERVAED